MKKIIGIPDQYYIQTNNAVVEFGKDYYHAVKMVSCGCECAAIALDITGKIDKISIPGIQPGDILMMGFHNPVNLPLFKKARNLDTDRYPPNEVPQYYPVLLNDIIYQERNVCNFEWGLNFELLKNGIDRGWPTMLCGEFPCGGHYVLCVGYDITNNTQKIIINDPYPVQWKDGKGYNKEFFFIGSGADSIIQTGKDENIIVKLNNFVVGFFK